MNIKHLLLIIVCTVLFSCGGDESVKKEPKYQLVVFWDNYAFGGQHVGMYLTDDGSLYSFVNNTRLPNYDGIFSGETYDETYIDELIGDDPFLLEVIDQETFNKLINTKNNVQMSDISDEEHRCYDTGRILYATFEYDAKKEVYSPIVLEEKGDWARQNNSSSAMELSSWLNSKLKEYQLIPPDILDYCKF
ncbi:hypothetical protein QWY77_10050 [Thalassotalea ponticola]|uniref:hypothetical protein n=1 Tax=Thalassotalea ponticola TaxID=1523392 RepID=UPI0025B52286|nr:hypothetical protein [Thalassotalea ponticola]MDN3653096.1 hypothetical protein [Thalassotalea ponticola]